MDLVALMCIKSGRNQNNIRFKLEQTRENFLNKLGPPVFRRRFARVNRYVKDPTRVHAIIIGPCVLFRSARTWVETLTFLLKVVKKVD